MPTLIQYRHPLPTTLVTAGIAAFIVWVLANFIIGTDYLWFRVTNVFALVLLTPAALESGAAAIINSPDDRNLRVLYGAVTAYISCLFLIIAFFGYIQYASTFSKLLLAAVALGVGIYESRKTPDIPAETVKFYKPVNSLNQSGVVWFFMYYILPLFLFLEIFITLIPPTLADTSATRDIEFPDLSLLLLIFLTWQFPRVATRPKEKVYFWGKYIIRDKDIPVLIAALIIFANSILHLQ